MKQATRLQLNALAEQAGASFGEAAYYRGLAGKAVHLSKPAIMNTASMAKAMRPYVSHAEQTLQQLNVLKGT